MTWKEYVFKLNNFFYAQTTFKIIFTWKIRKRANLIFPTSAVADPNSGAVELAGEDVTGHVLHCACVTAPALCQARRGANTGGRLRCNRCNRCRWLWKTLLRMSNIPFTFHIYELFNTFFDWSFFERLEPSELTEYQHVLKFGLRLIKKQLK